MFPLVAFGNLVIANELIVVIILFPLVFLYWFFQRVLKAQAVRILYEDKTGTGNVFPALWVHTQNRVTFKRSRREKITLRKKFNPKLINFSSVRREWWFRGKEGLKHTTEWGDASEEEKNLKIDASYEAISTLKYLVDELRYSAVQGLKANLPWVICGLGMGVGVGIVLMMFFGKA